MRYIKFLINKYKTMPVPAKASLWFVFCSVIQRGISFITVPLFTRIMTTEQYGVYSTYISWYSVLIVFTSLNVYYGVFNNAMVKYEGERDRYISSMQGLVTVTTGICFFVYLIFHKTFNQIFGLPTNMIVLLFVELWVTPALHFWTVHNRFDFKYRNVVAVTLLKSILNPGLGLVFVLFSEQKDLARIISTVLVEVLVCGAVAIYQFLKGKCFFNKEFWKFAVTFNLPLLPHYLSGTILNQGDRIVINALVGSSAVAFYSVAYNLGVVLNLVTTAVNASLTPWIYQELKQKRTSDIARITNMLLLMMAALIFLLMFFAPEILYTMAAPEYAEAVYVIPPIVASTFFVFLYNILTNVEFFYSERKYVSIGSICAAVLNLVLNWIFVPIYGYYAAGYTTLFCYIIYGLSHLWFSGIVSKKHLGVSSIYDKKAVCGLSLVVVILVVLQNFLYRTTFVRYGAILIILLICFIKRKTIVGVLKSLKKKTN